MTVKINLRPLREGRGLTKTQLGRALGVGQSYIWNIESGSRNPSIEMATKMAEFFGVPLDELVIPVAADASKPETPNA